MKYLSLLLITNIILAQQVNFVDFKTVNAEIVLNAKEKTVLGKVIYQFNVKKKVDTINIDAIRMDFFDVIINGKIVNYKKTDKKIALFEGFNKGKNTLCFRYAAQPKQALYFIDNQIWTQGQGKYTSHWFPSFDDVNEKLVFNLSIEFNKDYEVISNGVLQSIDNNGITKKWSFRMQNPMSSYLLMLAIGKFERQQLLSNSKIPLDLFIEPVDKSKFEPTYRYSKEIFDFFEKQIGVPYPWQVYKQIPVRDFVYAGMENTTATIFARDFVVDSIGYNDKNFINVNAHELAHHWYGDLITAKSGKHHWLQEAFATYYALLAEKNIFGEDHFNYKMYQTALQIKNASKTDTIPILNEKASSLSFYQKGAWALRIINDEIGDDKFQKAVKNYLNKYKFKTVETADFFAEINRISDFDTKKFQNNWLEKSSFDFDKCKEILLRNNAMKQYFEVLELSKMPYSHNKNKYAEILKSNAFYAVKELVIIQIRNIKFEDKVDLLRFAMQTNDIQVRQSVAQYFKDIPIEFKTEFEAFLSDNSYITKEIALNKLWQNFVDDRTILLDKTKDWIGFNDYNLRILWLNLALQTDNYKQESKTKFYEELLQFASTKYETEIRQNALENLIFLNNEDRNYLPFLVNAATNFKWQFASFARTKIRFFLKNKTHRTYFENLVAKLPENEKVLLERLLNETPM